MYVIGGKIHMGSRLAAPRFTLKNKSPRSRRHTSHLSRPQAISSTPTLPGPAQHPTFFMPSISTSGLVHCIVDTRLSQHL